MSLKLNDYDYVDIDIDIDGFGFGFCKSRSLIAIFSCRINLDKETKKGSRETKTKTTEKKQN